MTYLKKYIVMERVKYGKDRHIAFLEAVSTNVALQLTDEELLDSDKDASVLGTREYLLIPFEDINVQDDALQTKPHTYVGRLIYTDKSASPSMIEMPYKDIE